MATKVHVLSLNALRSAVARGPVKGNVLFDKSARAGTTPEVGAVLDTIAQAATAAQAKGLPLSIAVNDGETIDMGDLFGPGSVTQGWDQRGMHEVNPVSAQRRLRPYPVKLLPANVTTTATGTATITWTTQEAFQPWRLCMPSAQASAGAFLAQLFVGTQLITTVSGTMPMACFSEKSDAGRLDLPVVKIGQTISASVTNGGNAKEVAGVWLGYALDRARRTDYDIVGIKLVPLGSNTITHATTSNPINIQPQIDVIARRVILDSTVTNGLGNIFCTAWNVGDSPQLVANTEFPVLLWSDLAVDDWLDSDPLRVGQQYSFTFRSAEALNDIAVQGYILCDVIKFKNAA